MWNRRGKFKNLLCKEVCLRKLFHQQNRRWSTRPCKFLPDIIWEKMAVRKDPSLLEGSLMIIWEIMMTMTVEGLITNNLIAKVWGGSSEGRLIGLQLQTKWRCMIYSCRFVGVYSIVEVQSRKVC